MLRSTFAAHGPAALFLAMSMALGGCIFDSDHSPRSDGPDSPHDDPLCDVDRDGYLDASCGGQDCDDGDATVHPGADEWLGDEVDRDCDGAIGLSLARVSVPPNTWPIDWRFDDRGRTLGGLIHTDGGRLAGHSLHFGDEFGQGLVAQDRTIYGEFSSVTAPSRRLYDDKTPIDIFVEASQGEYSLQVWSLVDGTRSPRIFEDTLAGEGAYTSVDGFISSDGDLHAVACGDGTLRYLRIDPKSGALLADHVAASSAQSCAMLAPHDEVLILVIGDGTLSRWRIGSEGLVDELPLASIDPTQFRTASAGGHGWFVVVNDGGVLALNESGKAVVLATEGVVGDIGVDVDVEGRLAVAWVDATGDAMVAVRESDGSVLSRVVPAPTGVESLAVSLAEGELTVAVWDGADLSLARARR